MNAEVKTEWLSGLRSGKYRQGKGCLLSTEGKYCCLGVLCEISRKGQFNLEETQGVPGYEGVKAFPFVCNNGTTDITFLPTLIQEYAGLRKYQVDRLVSMNDGSFTFEEIANHIEKAF